MRCTRKISITRIKVVKFFHLGKNIFLYIIFILSAKITLLKQILS